MSYILDALRKMERQKRKDSGSESLVDQLTARTDEEGAEVARRPERLVIAVSIFFGLTGILMGLLFLIVDNPDRENREKGRAAQPQAAVGQERPEMTEVPQREKGPGAPAETATTLKAATLSDTISMVKEKAEGDTGENSPVANVEGSLPTAPPLKPQQEKVIDLTDRHRLTSTGHLNDRKYATIERNDYFIGDEFKGMVVTAIEKDRVHLRGKADAQRYVIIFRYR